jgi:hypothetical protein
MGMAEDQLMYYKIIDIGRNDVYLYRTRFEPHRLRPGEDIVYWWRNGKWRTSHDNKTILDKVKDRGSYKEMKWTCKYIKIDEEEFQWLAIN